MVKFSLFLLFIGVTLCYAQNKVQWSIEYDDQKELILLNGDIEPGWHLYSAQTPLNAGPIPVEVSIQKNRKLKLRKKFVEKLVPTKIFDTNFESDVYIFEENYVGEQKIKIKKETVLNLTVTYMICNDERCLPPIDEVLSIKLNTHD
jgi:thiol:disulfide interchange protein DsbD